MSSTEPPLPPLGAFEQSVRDSSRSARVAANIKIERDSIERLLLSPAFTTTFERVSAYHGLAFPLKFPSILAELNFLSILSILNFGSGYRTELHRQTRRGAWDSIRAFVFSMYLGDSDLLSAKGLKSIGDQTVAEFMGVSLHSERPHESIAGITVGELGGPAYDLVKLVTGTLNSTGEALLSQGYSDLGSFVLEALKVGEKTSAEKGPGAEVGIILERLVRAIPPFRDMAMVDDQPIYCFKKALFLIYGVHVRFGRTSSPPFPIPYTNEMPICADNVIPSLLIHLGVIDLSAASSHSLSSLFPHAGSKETVDTLLAVAPTTAHASDPSDNTKKEVPKEGPVLTVEQAFILRAAAIDACELIVEVARTLETVEGQNLDWMKHITLPELDTWLWAVAKDRPDYRQLERFALKGTAFF